jgi:hypothetical protein
MSVDSNDFGTRPMPPPDHPRGHEADNELVELVFGDQVPLLGFDLEFRREVAQLVHDILARCYVTRRDATIESARLRRLTVEQLVASAIAHHVMKKVDEEYI